MNFATTKLDKSDGKVTVKLGEQTIGLDDSVLSDRKALENFIGKDLIVGIRPQDFEDASLKADAPEDCKIKVTADLVESIGTETLVHFDAGAPVVITEEMKELAADVGAEGNLEERAKEGNNEFVGQLDAQSKIKKGQSAELVIDTTRLHFFDPDTSQAIYSDK